MTNFISINGAGYNTAIEDVPSSFYDSEIRFRLVSDCCNTGVYKSENENTCMNCSDSCDVLEDLIID